MKDFPKSMETDKQMGLLNVKIQKNLKKLAQAQFDFVSDQKHGKRSCVYFKAAKAAKQTQMKALCNAKVNARNAEIEAVRYLNSVEVQQRIVPSPINLTLGYEACLAF